MVMQNETPAPSGAMVRREEFGAREIATTGEKAQSALAARMTAEIQSRYVMALQRPRDVMEARDRLLKECGRTGFAEVARYSKPVGAQRIEGPSIRFVEAALRCFRNVSTDVFVTDDTAEARTLRVTVTDLEANLPYSADVTVQKVVERSKLRAGQVPLRARTNSAGNTTYLVEASEDEFLNKQNALVSKAVRTLGLRILPGDLVEEGQARCQETLRAETERDPRKAQKALVDAFSAIGVTPQDLAHYLGHTAENTTPAEITELRAVWSAIRDRETTWRDALEAKHGAKEPAEGAAPASRAESIKERLQKKNGAAPAAPAAPAAAAQPAETAPAGDPAAPTVSEKGRALATEIDEAENPGALAQLRAKVEKFAKEKGVAEPDVAHVRAALAKADADFKRSESSEG